MTAISMPANRAALHRRLVGAIAQIRAQSGQATSESAVLLFTVCVVSTGVGGWLMNSHPAWLNALSIHIHSFYYLLSLPFP